MAFKKPFSFYKDDKGKLEVIPHFTETELTNKDLARMIRAPQDDNVEKTKKHKLEINGQTLIIVTEAIGLKSITVDEAKSRRLNQ